ncbi:hypothetical protein FRC12_002164 [Ceratobasidium sp. 428]|nr:hypothetical protein FRC12_002164 [Ceratobasidium sp. 428]
MNVPSLNLQLKVMGEDCLPSSTKSFPGQLLYRDKGDLTGKTIITHFHIHDGLLVVEVDDSREGKSSVAVATLSGTCTHRNYQYYTIWESL